MKDLNLSRPAEAQSKPVSLFEAVAVPENAYGEACGSAS